VEQFNQRVMKKNLIAVTVIGVMSLLIFLYQRDVVENLREEISTAHVKNSLQQRSGSRGSVSESRYIGRLNPGKLRDLMTAFRNQEGGAEDHRALLKSLELVENYSRDDLFVILDQLNHERVGDSIISEQWRILISARAMAAPMKTLEYLDQIPNTSELPLFRISALRSLAERNLQGAVIRTSPTPRGDQAPH